MARKPRPVEPDWRVESQSQNRVQVCQAKLDKHRKPMDRANLQRGLNSRVASMSKDYSQLAGLYKKYAEELKSAENTDVDPDLLALSVVNVEVAQRTADAYEHYARTVQLDTTEHPIESELRLRGQTGRSQPAFGVRRSPHPAWRQA